MQSIKGTLLLLALCLCSSSIWADSQLAAEGDGKIKVKVKVKTSAAVESSKALSEELTTNLETATKNLDTKITAAGALVTASKNSIKKKALGDGLEALNLLKDNAAALKKELESINEELGESLDKKIDETLTGLNTWADEQVARASKTSTKAGINQAKSLTRNLVRRYSIDLPQATRDLTKATKDFERQVNNAIKLYTAHAKKLFGDMEACEKATASRCQTSIQGERVSASTAELNRLIKLGKKLIDTGTYARGRVTFLIEKLAKDQALVEKEIDGIIEFQKDPNADDLTEKPTTDEKTEENTEENTKDPEGTTE